MAGREGVGTWGGRVERKDSMKPSNSWADSLAVSAGEGGGEEGELVKKGGRGGGGGGTNQLLRERGRILSSQRPCW